MASASPSQHSPAFQPANASGRASRVHCEILAPPSCARRDDVPIIVVEGIESSHPALIEQSEKRWSITPAFIAREPFAQGKDSLFIQSRPDEIGRAPKEHSRCDTLTIKGKVSFDERSIAEARSSLVPRSQDTSASAARAKRARSLLHLSQFLQRYEHFLQRLSQSESRNDKDLTIAQPPLSASSSTFMSRYTVDTVHYPDANERQDGYMLRESPPGNALREPEVQDVTMIGKDDNHLAEIVLHTNMPFPSIQERRASSQGRPDDAYLEQDASPSGSSCDCFDMSNRRVLLYLLVVLLFVIAVALVMVGSFALGK